MKKILVMGLPGAGKTYFAERLKTFLESHSKVKWFNADEVRKQFNDWDFSREGRIRQSLRMSELAAKSDAEYVICDFVAPLPEMRNNFKADWTIWIDTIESSIYEDTNIAFVAPDIWNFRIVEQNADKWAPSIGLQILKDIKAHEELGLE